LPIEVYPLALSEQISETRAFKPPLGWYLSEETRSAIRERIGDPLHLKSDPCAQVDPKLTPLSILPATQAQIAADAAVSDLRSKLSPY
jgi:hypothetical protein